MLQPRNLRGHTHLSSTKTIRHPVTHMLRLTDAYDDGAGQAGPMEPVRQPLTASDVLTYQQLRRTGLSDKDIAADIKAARLRRMRRGVFIDAQRWNEAPFWEQNVVSVVAHHAISQERGIYSHLSAARLIGVDLWNAPSAIHVMHTGRRGDRAPLGDVIRHNQIVPPQQVIRVNGILTTSLERTIVDCARILTPESALVMADSGLRLGASTPKLQGLVKAGVGSRNINRVRQVLEIADGRSESAGESRLRLNLLDWHFPAPVLQLEIPTVVGLFRADMGWPELRLIAEFDGAGKYTAYGRTEQALIDERRRETHLMEAGWQIIRVRWQDLNDDVGLRQRFDAAFERARLQSPPGESTPYPQKFPRAG